MHPLAKVLAAIGVLSLLVAGCGGPGQGIADRIRAANSPIVREVFLSPANFLEGSGDAVDVFLIDEASDAQALDLWCTVVIPAGAAQLPKGRVQLQKGSSPASGEAVTGGSRVLDDDPICPEAGSVAPGGRSIGPQPIQAA